jgi:hypothetical protein
VEQPDSRFGEKRTAGLWPISEATGSDNGTIARLGLHPDHRLHGLRDLEAPASHTQPFPGAT